MFVTVMLQHHHGGPSPRRTPTVYPRAVCCPGLRAAGRLPGRARACFAASWGSSHQLLHRRLWTYYFIVELFMLLLGLWYLPILFWDSGAKLDELQTGSEEQEKAVPAFTGLAPPGGRRAGSWICTMSVASRSHGHTRQPSGQ